MTLIDVIGCISGIIGIITGAIGVQLSLIANKKAQEANTLSQKANEIAAESNEISIKSNSLATQANKHSEEANSISQRALNATTDQTIYQWATQLNASKDILILFNGCALTARDVHIIIRFKDQTIINENIENWDAFEKITFKSALFRNEIANSLPTDPHILSSGKITLRISIVWISEAGIRRSYESDQTFSSHPRKKIL